MKKFLLILSIILLVPINLSANEPKSLFPAFTKWLLDNGYNQYVDIDSNGVPKHNLKLNVSKRMWKLPYDLNPNRDTLIYYFYRYNFSHRYPDPNTYTWLPIEIKPSKKPYKFEFNLIEDKFVKKQLKTKGLVSYLYYQDGKILIDEISPDEKLGAFVKDDTRLISMSMGKSVMSYILGHAICEGYIDGVDSKIDDWPVLKTSLYDNQKLIDLLNMAAGDQKIIYEWGDGAGIKENNDFDYMIRNIRTTMGFYFQNTEKSKSIYNYNGFTTMILHNYLRHKTGDNYKVLLNKIFQNKVKNEHSVQFVQQNDGLDEWGIGSSMVRITRHDWLRLAKAMMDDYQNDTCVGKYLKEIHKRRIPKNLGGDKDEPEFGRTKTYGGQFHFDYPGLKNRVVFGLNGRGGQAILIDVENSRIVVINSIQYNNGKYKYNVKKLLIDPIKKGEKAFK